MNIRWRAETIIATVGLIVLVIAGIISYAAQSAPATPYASNSAAPDGTLALYRWLATLGYQPARLTAAPQLTPRLCAIIALEPQAAFTPAEVAHTLRWVRGGGTLVLLEDGGDTALPGALGLSIRPLPAPSGLSLFPSTAAPYGAAPVQPLLAHPPLQGLSTVVAAGVYSGRPGVVAVLGNGGVRPPGAGKHEHIASPDAGNPVLVYEQLGRGRVYAGTTPAALTNSQIALGDNRRFMFNLLAGLPRGAQVGFDDYHLVATAPAPATLNEALAATWWGRALLYALALGAAYIVLSGRRLGRPLTPLPERGRSLAEYVLSMAALFRRAGLRTRVLALWQSDLRHELAGTGRAGARADAELVMDAVRRANLTPDEQTEALDLLRPRESLSESALVELCRRIARLRQRLTARLEP